MSDIDTHDLMMPFGKHANQRITRLPVGYLKWMVNNLDKSYATGSTTWADVARAELDRRGTRLQASDPELSGHAIDRASQRCLAAWQSTHKPNEGLHTWLSRLASEALRAGPVDGREDRYRAGGVTFIIDTSMALPVVKTVH